jgi:hypothetical protein
MTIFAKTTSTRRWRRTQRRSSWIQVRRASTGAPAAAIPRRAALHRTADVRGYVVGQCDVVQWHMRHGQCVRQTVPRHALPWSPTAASTGPGRSQPRRPSDRESHDQALHSSRCPLSDRDSGSAVALALFRLGPNQAATHSVGPSRRHRPSGRSVCRLHSTRGDCQAGSGRVGGVEAWICYSALQLCSSPECWTVQQYVGVPRGQGGLGERSARGGDGREDEA